MVLLDGLAVRTGWTEAVCQATRDACARFFFGPYVSPGSPPALLSSETRYTDRFGALLGTRPETAAPTYADLTQALTRPLVLKPGLCGLLPNSHGALSTNTLSSFECRCSLWSRDTSYSHHLSYAHPPASDSAIQGELESPPPGSFGLAPFFIKRGPVPLSGPLQVRLLDGAREERRGRWGRLLTAVSGLPYAPVHTFRTCFP